MPTLVLAPNCSAGETVNRGRRTVNPGVPPGEITGLLARFPPEPMDMRHPKIVRYSLMHVTGRWADARYSTRFHGFSCSGREIG